MRARCPKNNKHNRFVTIAHVVEDWVVDEKGNWLETIGTLETVAPPNIHNTWACHICGEEAIVEESSYGLTMMTSFPLGTLEGDE